MGGRLDAPPPRIRGDSDLSQTFPPREVSYRKLFSFVLPVGISATRKRVSYRRQSRFRRGANASSSQTPPAGQPGGGKGSSTLCQHESQTDKVQKASFADMGLYTMVMDNDQTAVLENIDGRITIELPPRTSAIIR